MHACIYSSLINLNATKNLLVEPQRTQQSHSTRDQVQPKANQCHVPKVQNIRRHTVALQLLKVMERIPIHIQGSGSSRAETSPPPTVILTTDLKVRKENGNLSTGQEQNDKGQEQKPKHVIVLIHPNTRHDEKELEEARSKGHDSTHGCRERPSHEPWLVGNLTGDVGGIDWELNGILLEPKVGTKEYQWRGNT